MSSLKPVATRVRSVFLSDLHLGTRECRADLLLDFLHRVQPEQLFLVGDIIDLQAMRRNFYWPQLHNNVLRTILGKAKHDTHIINGNRYGLIAFRAAGVN